MESVGVDFDGDRKQGMRIIVYWRRLWIWGWGWATDILVLFVIAGYNIYRQAEVQTMANNELCISIPLLRKDYELISTRLSGFGLVNLGTQQLQLSILSYIPQQTRKQPPQKKPRKHEHTIIRLSNSISSTYLMPSYPISSTNFPSLCMPIVQKQDKQKFIEQAIYLRCDNNFKNIIKGWSIFGEIKEVESKIIEIEVFQWKDAHLIQFVHADNEEVLMIVRDLTSTNFTYRNNVLDREKWFRKFYLYFQDIYVMLSSLYKEDTTQARSQPQGLPTIRQKAYEFEDRMKKYVQKMLRLTQKQQKLGTQSNAQKITVETKFIQFWMVRISEIVDFSLKNFNGLDKDRENKKSQMKDEKDKQKEKEKEKQKKQEDLDMIDQM